MSRFFNTQGPVNPEWHYSLPPLSRIDMGHVWMLIDQQMYFGPRAPRRSGKTSCLLAMQDALDREGKHLCVHVNLNGTG